MATFEQDRLYQKSHEWVKLEDDDTALSGISDYAQEELNDVVYVELPEVGDSFERGEAYAVVESVKAASDVYMPMSGEILEVNEGLVDSPQWVNESPYQEGWFIKFRVINPDQAQELMDADAYEQFCAQEGG